MLVFIKLKNAARLPERREFVARVGGGQPAGGQFEDTHPHRDEHLRFVVGTDRIISPFQDLRRRIAHHRHALQDDLARHHEQRSGYTLAGHIRDHHAQVIVVDQEVVVEVAAHLLGRIHAGVDVKFPAHREGREDVRQHGRLDVCRQRQLRADPGGLRLLLLVLLNQILHDHAGHVDRRADGRQYDDLHIVKKSLYNHRGNRRYDIVPESDSRLTPEFILPAHEEARVQSQHNDVRQIGEQVARRAMINVSIVEIEAQRHKLSDEHQHNVQNDRNMKQLAVQPAMAVRIGDVQRELGKQPGHDCRGDELQEGHNLECDVYAGSRKTLHELPEQMTADVKHDRPEEELKIPGYLFPQARA